MGALGTYLPFFTDTHISCACMAEKGTSVSTPLSPRQSLLEGKKASERLRYLTTEMEDAASSGMATDHLQE